MFCLHRVQSQHAEKLLEINQNMLERDKALKLELDVATSLNKDMTMRLAMAQRSIKQLSEKLATMDVAETASKEAHNAALHDKVSGQKLCFARLLLPDTSYFVLRLKR